jgi:hypothetical protein
LTRLEPGLCLYALRDSNPFAADAAGEFAECSQRSHSAPAVIARRLSTQHRSQRE